MQRNNVAGRACEPSHKDVHLREGAVGQTVGAHKLNVGLCVYV